jgi:hypothetical protein
VLAGKPLLEVGLGGHGRAKAREKLQEALLQVFPGADLGEVLVVEGKHLKGSGKGKSPQVRLVEVLALHLLTTLAQAKAEGREDQALLELLDRLGAEGLKGGAR